MTRPIVYLAAPYSHSDPAVREARFRAITHATATLVAAGHVVFSPITHSHPIDVVLKERGVTELESVFWLAYDLAFMATCSMIIVFMLDGWGNSSGVAREIKFFEDRRRPVLYMNPSTEEIVLAGSHG